MEWLRRNWLLWAVPGILISISAIYYQRNLRLFWFRSCQTCDLQYWSLVNADLSGANLQGADLRNANLTGANFAGANLSNAQLEGAQLWEANLGGAQLRGAYYDAATRFPPQFAPLSQGMRSRIRRIGGNNQS